MKTKLKTVGMTTAILAALMALMMAPTVTAFSLTDEVDATNYILLVRPTDPLCPVDHPSDPYGVNDGGETWCIIGETHTGEKGVFCHYIEHSTGPNHGLPVSYDGHQECTFSIEENGDICIGYGWKYSNYGGIKDGDKYGHTCEKTLHTPL